MAASATLPFFELPLSSKIQVPSHYMDCDIDSHVLQFLRQTKEGSCNRWGFLLRIFGLTSLESAEIPAEDLLCRTVVKVHYNGLICNPTRGTYIIARVNKIDHTLISCTLGPILALVPIEHVNIMMFSQTTGGLLYKPQGQLLEPGALVKIKVLAKKVVRHDKRIMIIASLENVASEDEGSRFFVDLSSGSLSQLMYLLKQH